MISSVRLTIAKVIQVALKDSRFVKSRCVGPKNKGLSILAWRMFYFFKCLSITLVVQLVAAGLAFGLPKIFGAIWGGLAYLLYLMPIILIAGSNSGEKHEVSSFFLFGVPMVVWSLIVSTFICLLRGRGRNNGKRLA